MNKIIRKIPYRKMGKLAETKIRVVAYARVSTNKEEQLTSLEAQKDYFINYIENNAQWEFAGIYYDEGISGVCTKNRTYFNLMIEDGMNGKFDLIVTKSISRFARNTLDTIHTIRKLKEKGIGVYFQKENIQTLDAKGEFILTLMASFAQEESRSISENIKWGKRKRMADGKVAIAYTQFLGYDKGKDGNLIINIKEAQIIECIYSLFIIGFTRPQIIRFLNKNKILTPTGREKWNTSYIKSILTNEKYKGDALLQKAFTVDYLSKKKKKNEGELRQYYIENNHEPIISKEIHQYVNSKLDKFDGSSRSTQSLSGKIYCKECGEKFGSFIIHPEFKSANGNSLAWKCKNKYSKTNKCTIRHVYDKKIYDFLLELCVQRFVRNNKLKKILWSIIGKKKIKTINTNFLETSVDVGVIVSEIHIDKQHNCQVKWIDGVTNKGTIKETRKYRKG